MEISAIPNGKGYYIETFGCQMNVHDSEMIAGMLGSLGYTKGAKEQADFILFNTCCVREHAESKVYGHLGRLKEFKERNPQLIIAVCGCMMQQRETAIRLRNRFPYVDIIFGTHNLNDLPSMIADVEDKRIRVFDVVDSDGDVVEGLPINRTQGVSAFVNIMFGCNNFCTYCIVPYVRGRERSRMPEHIIDEVRGLTADGVMEVTLLGQNVNSYAGGLGFPELLQRVSEIPGIRRIRFMTSHPKDMSAALIEVIAKNSNICSHIHLPVQSGSNEILKAMNRGYTREHYLGLVGRIRETIPGVELTTDIIVGFPGESDANFGDSLRLVDEVGFSAAFTFQYSPREGTKAAALSDQLPSDVKKRRLLELNEHLADGYHRMNGAYVGTLQHVLVTGVREGGDALLYGRSHGSKMVFFAGSEDLIDRIIDVRITGVRENGLIGEAVELV